MIVSPKAHLKIPQSPRSSKFHKTSKRSTGKLRDLPPVADGGTPSGDSFRRSPAPGESKNLVIPAPYSGGIRDYTYTIPQDTTSSGSAFDVAGFTEDLRKTVQEDVQAFGPERAQEYQGRREDLTIVGNAIREMEEHAPNLIENAEHIHMARTLGGSITRGVQNNQSSGVLKCGPIKSRTSTSGLMFSQDSKSKLIDNSKSMPIKKDPMSTGSGHLSKNIQVLHQKAL